MEGPTDDDIMFGLGGFDKFDSGLGFDWATYANATLGQRVDMNRKDCIGTALRPQRA